jgi:hypothetical protein
MPASHGHLRLAAPHASKFSAVFQIQHRGDGRWMGPTVTGHNKPGDKMARWNHE